MTTDVESRLEALPEDARLDGDGPIAALRVSPEDLDRRSVAGLGWQSSEEQLGSAKVALLLDHASGSRFALISYDDVDEPETVVYGPRDEAALTSLLEALRASSDEILDRFDQDVESTRVDAPLATTAAKVFLSFGPRDRLVTGRSVDVDVAALVEATHATALFVAQDADAGLTPRQLEVVEAVGAGRTARDIAEDLGVQRGTVVDHFRRGLQRFGEHDPAAARELFEVTWRRLLEPR